MTITNDIKYIGVNDHKVDLFEALYPSPYGMAYNSYVILDEKIAVMDTMDGSYGNEWFEKLDAELNGRIPDYLVIHHMEPDHSANILAFMEKYPNAIIVASKLAFPIIKNFFGTDFEDRRIVASEGTELNLGKHTLKFYSAPMVHWPEVIVSYVPDLKLLFSADAFGKFGALDVDQPWEDEARRYFFSIVGRFCSQTANLLKKLEGLEVETICALHGPVLKENIAHYVGLYKRWSSYQPDEEGYCISYVSVYGHTEKAIFELAENLKAQGKKVVLHDLARCNMYQALADAFKYDKLVLASTTYYGDMFPAMKHYITMLVERNYQNREVFLIENGSWSPTAAGRMKAALADLKININEKITTIRSNPSEPISL